MSRRPLNVLDGLHVPEPCLAPWTGMAGDGRVRRCGRCREAVYDLSAFTAAEAARILESTGGVACVRFTLDAAGSVVTRERPAARLLPRFGRRVAVAAAAWLGLTVASGCTTQGKPCNVPRSPATHSAPGGGHAGDPHD